MKNRLLSFCLFLMFYSTTTMAQVIATLNDSTNVSCNGFCNGSATVSANGGSGSYTYSWNTIPAQNTPTATGLCAGNYSCTVSDDSCVPSGTELLLNGDFETGNTGFSSSYTFTTPPNTNSGQYWVGTNTQLPSWNGFMTSNGDHTSGTGNMLFVNAASFANTSVWCQTISVTPNTTYLFSAWVSSIHPSSPAQLQFSINGVLIGAIDTAAPVVNLWTQFFTSWNSGSNTTASICIVNQNTEGFGNDFALDDISFQECSLSNSATVSVTISQPDSLLVSPIPSVDICKGDTALLNVLATGGTGSYVYTWLPSGTGNTSSVLVTPLSTSTYSVTASDSSGCVSPETVVTVNVADVTSSFVPDIDSGVVNLTVNFNNTSNDANTYVWNFGNVDNSIIENPVYTYTSIGTYTVMLIANNTNGCSDTTFTEIKVIPAITLTPTSCNATCDGTAMVTAATDSTAALVYSWNTVPAQFTPTATGLCAENYVCTITDTTCNPSGVELVVNGNFETGNTGFSSSYTYTPPANTTEGQYWVATGALVSSWNGGLTSTGDHTSGNGNLMMVNASPFANVSIWCQNITVTPNTTYLFSTWLSSIHPTNPAQLQFSINGISVGDILNAPASTGIWTQFFTSWNSGSATTADICIVNQNTNGAGNDFAIDDISFQECSLTAPVTVSVTISEPSQVLLDSIPSVTVCSSEDVVFTANASGGSGNYTYTWLPTGTGSGPSVSVSAVASTTYTVSAIDSNGCISSSITATVYNHEVVASFISSVDSGLVNLQVDFTNSSTGATDYNWDLDANTSSTLDNTSITYTNPGVYNVILIASNSTGCADTATISIKANENSPALWIPNTITPNSDGLNDVFYVKGENLRDFNGKIFNRWGQLLFEWNDLLIGWDGKYKGRPVPDGTYVYIISATDIHDDQKEKTGHITVLNQR